FTADMPCSKTLNNFSPFRIILGDPTHSINDKFITTRLVNGARQRLLEQLKISIRHGAGACWPLLWYERVNSRLCSLQSVKTLSLNPPFTCSLTYCSIHTARRCLQ